jgi:hypothetical protein
MKIIDAYWEKENLGLTTLEIIFEDPEEQLPLDLIREYEYIVVKVQSLETKTVHMLERSGFEFIESQLLISKSVNEIKIDPFLKRISSAYELEKVESMTQMQIILKEIGNGLFNTDRIYLDPALGKDLAIRRYKNWAESIFHDIENYKVFMLSRKKDKRSVGFISLKTTDKENCGIPLAGIFADYKKLNIGYLVIYFPLIFALNNGFKYCRTAISLNNLNIVNLYNLFGYKIDKTYSVLRKLKGNLIRT